MNWTDYTQAITIEKGQSLYLKSYNPDGWSHKINLYTSIEITGDVSLSGNIMSLLDNGAKPGEQGDITGIPCDWCFWYLFKNSTGITSVSEDFLPATTLADYCYATMFQDCTSLTTAPDLPATVLAIECYDFMFNKCPSLNSIKIGYTGDYDSTYFSSWVSGVASSGTFYYNGSQTAQDFELPSGWTKQKF